MEYFNANTAGLICRQYYFKQHRAAIHILIIGKKSGKWYRISTSLNLIKNTGMKKYFYYSPTEIRVDTKSRTPGNLKTFQQKTYFYYFLANLWLLYTAAIKINRIWK